MIMTSEQAPKSPPARGLIARPVAPREPSHKDPGQAHPAVSTHELCIFFGSNQVLKRVSLDVPAKAVTAIIGPSGCGKSTFLRAINRMHDLVPSSRVEGKVRLFGEDIYGPGIEPVQIRRRIGMVFQKYNPFPTMSIAENVTVGLRLNGVRNRSHCWRSKRSNRCGWPPYGMR